MGGPNLKEHDEFMKRIKKSLYYSKLPVNGCLSLPVTELVAEFYTEVKSDHTLKKLEVEEASRISENVSPCPLVLALLYVERLKNCNREYLQHVTPSELFLVSLMVACKFLYEIDEEDGVFNDEWAKAGLVTVQWMNKLEKDFLAAIDWTVWVQSQDFWKRLQRLEQDVAYREVRKRGWCTYTELNCLMNPVQLITIAQTLINVSSICLATYAAGLATLLGSTLVTCFVVNSILPGALLGPRQPKNLETNVTPIELTYPIINTQSQEIDDNNLPISILLDSDESIVDYASTAQFDNKDDDVVWQWWLNSMMTWLPKYCTLESNVRIPNSTRLCVTNASSSFKTSHITEIEETEETEDYNRNVNWKEILAQDWRSSHGLHYESVFQSPASKKDLTYAC